MSVKYILKCEDNFYYASSEKELATYIEASEGMECEVFRVVWSGSVPKYIPRILKMINKVIMGDDRDRLVEALIKEVFGSGC